MLVNTRHFGEIDLEENKIIYFEHGILGFEDCKEYTILYDEQDGNRPEISWLQSLDEVSLAIPVVSPGLVKQDYNPNVDDELLKPLGELTEENLVVLVSVTVPVDVTKISANLKAPFIINADTRRAVQIITEGTEHEVKHYFYHRLMENKAAKGDK